MNSCERSKAISDCRHPAMIICAMPAVMFFAIAWIVLAADDAPKPQPNADVTFHIKPKPLPAGAVTEDWKSFMGPNHNGISGETKLLRNWPKGGPTLVWEMRKGTGYSSPAIAGEYLVYFHGSGDRE